MTPAKQLWLLAGGNGAGKTTFYKLFLQSHGLGFVNADLIAKQIEKDQPEKISYQAADLAGKLRLSLLKKGTSFCFETVFSHPSKIDFVAQAKTHGYETILVYIHLENAELNQARVAQRVTEGGHGVPVEKIISRIPRTMVHIRMALPLFDTTQFYDNSSRENPFKYVAQIRDGKFHTTQKPLPDWAEHILGDYI